MKCPKCNLEVSDDSQFCSNCGVNIYEYNSSSKTMSSASESKPDTPNDGACPEAIGWILILVITAPIILIPLLQTDIPIGFIILGALLIVACIFACVFASKAKDVVISIGRKTLDFLTILDVALCVIVIVLGFIQCVYEDGISHTLWWYILGAVILFFGTLLANYTLYLLIDIRDSLKKLSDTKGE